MDQTSLLAGAPPAAGVDVAPVGRDHPQRSDAGKACGVNVLGAAEGDVPVVVHPQLGEGAAEELQAVGERAVTSNPGAPVVGREPSSFGPRAPETIPPGAAINGTQPGVPLAAGLQPPPEWA